MSLANGRLIDCAAAWAGTGDQGLSTVLPTLSRATPCLLVLCPVFFVESTGQSS